MWRVVKCSNSTTGVDFFLFYFSLPFEDLCIVLSSEKSKACRSPLGVALNFWF